MEKIDKKVLIVEDDNIARDVLELILKKYFTNVYTAENGKLGLELSKKHAPDLVIADLAMPVLDGFIMLEKLKECCSDTRVLVVTAYREEAEECGNHIVMHKPVDRKELLKAISDMLQVTLPA